jgi:hypothetical protein
MVGGGLDPDDTVVGRLQVEVERVLALWVGRPVAGRMYRRKDSMARVCDGVHALGSVVAVV